MAYLNHKIPFHVYWCFKLPCFQCSHPTKMSCCILILQTDWNPTELPYHGQRFPLHCHCPQWVPLLDHWCCAIHLVWSQKSHIYQSYLLHLMLAILCEAVWSHHPLPHCQEICHCQYIFMSPMLWCVANSSGEECNCCLLWNHFERPWLYQWPWFTWVLPQLREQPCWLQVDTCPTKPWMIFNKLIEGTVVVCHLTQWKTHKWMK